MLFQDRDAVYFRRMNSNQLERPGPVRAQPKGHDSPQQEVEEGLSLDVLRREDPVRVQPGPPGAQPNTPAQGSVK